MNYFSKIKVGTWIVIVLTIINLASLATIYYKTSCERRKCVTANKEQQRQKGRDLHWRKLNLNQDQEVKFREKGKQYFDSIKVIFKIRDTLARQIVSELRKDNPDLELMYSFSQKMGENYGRSKILTIDHILKLKKLCRPEQVQKLDSMYYFLLVGFENPRHSRQGKRPDNDSTKIKSIPKTEN
jgi:hypothetical protein